ncbi:MAG: response regulator [bacterium]|nr:response regulator [bacterium]
MEKLKVLIVDDNERFCNNMVDILELKGYGIKGVYDGFQAIEAVKKEKFDIVLMDIKMPGLSGVETAKMLKGIVPGLNIIMITAFADDIAFKEELVNANLKIMQKPMDIDVLCGMLKTIS